jgi:hypothetical protein
MASTATDLPHPCIEVLRPPPSGNTAADLATGSRRRR